MSYLKNICNNSKTDIHSEITAGSLECREVGLCSYENSCNNRDIMIMSYINGSESIVIES